MGAIQMEELFLSRFTPSQMDHQTLERIFVQREEFLGRRLEQIREGLLTPARHYLLLIGPRGIGKTHLVSLVYHRVKEMEDLRARVCLAWLREEEWGATTFLTFLIRVLRAISRESANPELEARLRGLFDHDPSTAERLARELLLETLGDRVLLLLLENLDELFRQMGEEGQRRLRAFLQETACATILATAQSLSDDVRLQTAPFYGFFTQYHLEELTLEETSDLLVRIAEAQGKPDLMEYIHSPEGQARLRALRHLAGGNHRVYVIFSQFLTRQSLDELTVPFLRMVDDLTPYYQDRMRVLSPQQRQIVELLCERRGALPVKEIARWCFITPQVAASQLKELREKLYVVATPIGRESFYELREPLMRLTVDTKARGEGPIRLLVDFLRVWYTPPEIRDRLASRCSPLERPYLSYALGFSVLDSDPEIRALQSECRRLWQEKDHNSALPLAERLVARRGRDYDWQILGVLLGSLGHLEEALAALNRAIALNVNDAKSWYNHAFCLTILSRCDEALTSYERSSEIDKQEPLVEVGRGYCLCSLGRFEEAVSTFDRALTLSPDNPSIWYNRGIALIGMGRNKEAIASYDRALSIDQYDSDSWNNRGNALAGLNDYKEASHSYDRALELSPDDSVIWANRVASQLMLLLTVESSSTAQRNAIIALVQAAEQRGWLDLLGQRVVQLIPELFSVGLSEGTVRTWVTLWQEAGAGKPDLELPLRLMEAAIRWRERQDPRILLTLPAEERAVLEGLLPVEPS